MENNVPEPEDIQQETPITPEPETVTPEPETAPVAEAPPVKPLTSEQKLFALCAYLIPLLTSSNFIAPLVIWLLKKDEDAYVEQHAKESLNFQISFAIYVIVAWMSLIIGIGMLLFPAVAITYLVFAIIAGVNAYKGEAYRIPVCIRFIK